VCVVYLGNQFNPHFKREMRGNEVILKFASELEVVPRERGSDKNIWNFRIVFSQEGKKVSFDASTQGKRLFDRCSKGITKGAEFDLEALRRIDESKGDGLLDDGAPYVELSPQERSFLSSFKPKKRKNGWLQSKE
jgi:hypothetical protein